MILPCDEHKVEEHLTLLRPWTEAEAEEQHKERILSHVCAQPENLSVNILHEASAQSTHYGNRSRSPIHSSTRALRSKGGGAHHEIRGRQPTREASCVCKQQSISSMRHIYT